MNYCIINGKKSTLIKGLLIQSLPPVSKPLMRTQIEEIDGRDGDIVRKLGYSAYDKEMSIGLFGDYNIDEVISFFDTEGTVIFSNEPDKFYKFQLLNQIDFERLASFRTATVTFHVQPFKFSAVDDDFSFSSNQLDLKDYVATQHGVTVGVDNELITIQGTAQGNTEFFIPINPMKLDAEEYTLEAYATGFGSDKCTMRIIEHNPTNADSFGGTSLVLSAGENTLTATLTESKTFNYIWLEIEAGAQVDFVLDTSVLIDLSSIKVRNRGNTFSSPTLTIYGHGTVNLSINGTVIFIINLADAGYITIDGAEMNAYKGDVLMNRSVSGDYNNLKLKMGLNTISWSGDVTQIKLSNVSRWI